MLGLGPDDRILWTLSLAYHFAVTITAYLRAGAHVLLCAGHAAAAARRRVRARASDAPLRLAAPVRAHGARGRATRGSRRSARRCRRRRRCCRRGRDRVRGGVGRPARAGVRHHRSRPPVHQHARRRRARGERRPRGARLRVAIVTDGRHARARRCRRRGRHPRRGALLRSTTPWQPRAVAAAKRLVPRPATSDARRRRAADAPRPHEVDDRRGGHEGLSRRRSKRCSTASPACARRACGRPRASAHGRGAVRRDRPRARGDARLRARSARRAPRCCRAYKGPDRIPAWSTRSHARRAARSAAPDAVAAVAASGRGWLNARACPGLAWGAPWGGPSASPSSAVDRPARRSRSRSRRTAPHVAVFADEERREIVVGESLVPAIMPSLRRLGVEDAVAAVQPGEAGRRVRVGRDARRVHVLALRPSHDAVRVQRAAARSSKRLIRARAVAQGARIVAGPREARRSADAVARARARRLDARGRGVGRRASRASRRTRPARARDRALLGHRRAARPARRRRALRALHRLRVGRGRRATCSSARVTGGLELAHSAAASGCRSASCSTATYAQRLGDTPLARLGGSDRRDAGARGDAPRRDRVPAASRRTRTTSS